MAASVLAGLPMIELTTVGAKSGQLRTTPLLALQHGTSYVVIASSFGKPNHPAWYHNLCANPLVTVRRSQQSGTYAARVAEGDERARYWQLANQVYPGYNLYADAVGGCGGDRGGGIARNADGTQVAPVRHSHSNGARNGHVRRLRAIQRS
jgi:deazaflavin-dependent oxidoreductase (nitroreductase family)